MGSEVNILTPAEAFDRIRRTERQLYVQYDSWIATCQGGLVSSAVLDTWNIQITNGRNQINVYIANVSNQQHLINYAKDQFGSQQKQFIDDLSAVDSAWDSVQAWLTTNGNLDAEPPVDVDCTTLIPELQNLKMVSE